MIEVAVGFFRFIVEGVGPVMNGASVYTVANPYTEANLSNLRYVQSVDVVYLFCDGQQPRKLSRFGATDWRFEYIDFQNGPYLPESKKAGQLFVGSTGAAHDGTPTITENTSAGDTPPTSIFDGLTDTAWYGIRSQGWRVEYSMPYARTLNGYVVYPAKNNEDPNHPSLDYAPKTWTVQGWDGSKWLTLDRQSGYVLWDNYRSVYFDVSSRVPYTKYAFDVEEIRGNGDIVPALQELVFAWYNDDLNNIDLYQNGDLTDVNKGQGFLATDVGRHVRIMDADNRWRWAYITQYIDNRHVKIYLKSEPFTTFGPFLRWQFGAWSNTSGWPTCGVLYDDRLWLAGSKENPDMLAGSVVGSYEDFSQRTSADEVLDTSAVFVRLNSRKLSAIRWIVGDDKGLLIGTGTGEWVVSSSTQNGVITARDIQGKPQTERGSAIADAVKIDKQVLYIQGTGRTIREYAYVFDSDGFKSQSMSLFASNLGIPKFVQIVYASEPYSLVWMRRVDGSVVGLTYNRDEKVVGWHTHDFAGGIVENIATLPSVADNQDCLWLVVRRQVNGVTKRFIERLTRFWDFDSVVEEARFVDCSRVYSGATTNQISLPHLTGELVDGVVNGVPFKDVPVVSGVATLPFEGETIVAGLGYVSEAETLPIEAGAQIGTAQGKSKRINGCTVYLWESARGEVGTYNYDRKKAEYQDVAYSEPFDELQPVTLMTEMVDHTMPSGYGKFGTLLFRQTEPLPFNVISLMPDMATNDG